MLKRSICMLLSMLLAAAMILPSSAAQTSEVSGASNSYTTASEGIDSKYTYDGELGAIYTHAQTTFKLWAPLASSVVLKRYATGSDSEPGAENLGTVQMSKLMNGSKFTGVWTASVSGDLKNTYYTYSVTTPDVKGSGSSTHETQDVYSNAVGVNGKRSMVVDLDSTDPEGWEDDSHILPDVITTSFVWEVHVKDFSYNKNSGVSEKNRGKFLAFTETGTTLNGEGKVATCLDYLKNLGVTTVQINPFFDFASVDETGSDEQYNWGYDPMNYNVPEGSFSSDPYHGEVRVKECKQMIQALHSAGIAVVMDVVYNHTSGTDSCFGFTMPKYYYRMNDDGSYSNGSGCGNETASERAMYRKFMIDSCLYWVNEYHIDGFRFDLMALHDTETLNMIRDELDKIDSRITMWGEGWTGGSSTFPDKTCTGKAFQASYLWDHGDLSDRIGFFNDGIRNAIKGDTGSVYSKGWLQGAAEGNAEMLTQGMEAKKGYCFNWPAQAVTYDACHDNTTLWDQLCSSQGLEDHYYERNDKLAAQNKLAGALITMSQGVSFILAGEEMGRSKGGNENSYNAPAAVNMIDWSLADSNSDIVSYYRGLRDIRDHFWILNDYLRGNGGYYFLSRDSTIACTITNSISGQWRQLLFLANCNDYAVTYQVPSSYEQYWIVIADENEAGTTKLREVTNGNFTIAANSCVIAVDATSFNSMNITDSLGKVYVDYVGETTGQTFAKRTLVGKQGSDYSVYTPARFGNELVLDSIEGETTGKFTSSNTSVRVNYAYVKAGTVTVNYYDSGTKQTLKSSDVYSAMIGDTITLGATPSFVGYKLDSSSEPNKTIKVVPGNTDVNFYYAPTSSTVSLHFKHSGGQSWNPVLWLWGSKDGEDTGNYCTKKEWPGDTLYDADGDGWFDKTFAVSGDDCYNLLISNDKGEQTVDYRGLTQGELWIIIDDNRVWNYTDNLTIYSENPLENTNAPIAVRYGSIKYTNEKINPELIDIVLPSGVMARVNNNAVTKTITGALVELTLNEAAGERFTGFEINGGEVEARSTGTNSCEFIMPSEKAYVRAVYDGIETYTVDFSKDSYNLVHITTELADAVMKLECYDKETYTLDLNGDGIGDLCLVYDDDPVLVKMIGSKKIVEPYTFELFSKGYSDKYDKVEFIINTDIVHITFDSNGGSGTMDEVIIPAGEYTLPKCTFKAPYGYVFSSWDGGSANNFYHREETTVNVTEDTVFKAGWEQLWHNERKEPSCEEDGNIEYYTDSSFNYYTDKSGTPLTDLNNDGLINYADVTLKAVGHKYSAPKWEWNGYDSASAVFTCENDASHVETVQAAISISRTSTSNIYIASVNFNGEIYTDVREETVISSDSESDTESETDTNTETQTDSDSETQSDTNSETDTNSESDTDSNIDFDSNTETETETESDTNTDSETETDTNTETETDSTSDTDSDMGSDVGDTETDTETDTATDTGSDTETDTDTGSDTDTDTESDTDTDREEYVMIGDVDGDSSVTSSDALMLLRASIGLTTLDSDLIIVTDVTGDGTADSSDALEILRYSALISENDKIGKLVRIRRH